MQCSMTYIMINYNLVRENRLLEKPYSLQVITFTRIGQKSAKKITNYFLILLIIGHIVTSTAMFSRTHHII